jgi:hypothetical protein
MRFAVAHRTSVIRLAAQYPQNDPVKPIIPDFRVVDCPWTFIILTNGSCFSTECLVITFHNLQVGI